MLRRKFLGGSLGAALLPTATKASQAVKAITPMKLGPIEDCLPEAPKIQPNQHPLWPKLQWWERRNRRRNYNARMLWPEISCLKSVSPWYRCHMQWERSERDGDIVRKLQKTVFGEEFDW